MYSTSWYDKTECEKDTKDREPKTLTRHIPTMVALPLRIRPSIILFGDSLTQQGFGWEGATGWVSLLSAAYSRRADVLNRGFSGYNSRHGLDLVARVFGQPSEEGILFCTVFFGANDAALPGERQHVPLDEYGKNIGEIVTGIREQIGIVNTTEDAEGSCLNDVPVILMTPPPVDIDAWLRSRGNDEKPSYRANDVARKYGDKVKQVGNEFNCPVLDVFEALGGNGNDYGQNLRDGLHLSGKGNTLLYEALMELIEKEFPQLAPMTDGNGRYGKSGVPLEEKLWHEMC